VKQPSEIFGNDWVERARTLAPEDSWAAQVVQDLDTTGGSYLCTLRTWFHRYPLSAKAKRHMRSGLESVRNDEHLGAVNELAWWAFMRRQGLAGNPVPSSRTPLPDFHVEAPTECYVEVSTLNVSRAEANKLSVGSGIDLQSSQQETLRRIIGKMTDEKCRQLAYAAEKTKPCVLALFDYTAWSGLGTQFFRLLAQFLLGPDLGFRTFPRELSALISLERKVIDGRIVLNCERSAVYYNPLALYSLPPDTFSLLHQFSSQLVAVPPTPTQHWLCL
jgi:hypothetical protein